MADVELPLTTHLQELRSRLGRSLLAIGIGMALCYPRAELIFDVLTSPLLLAAQDSGTSVLLVGTGVAEAFFTRLKVAAIAGLFFALPVVLWQTWLFVAPGLRQTEAAYARAFVAFGTMFFLGGSFFCYAMVLPLAFPFFLAEYASIGIDPMIRISEYLSFISRLLIAFGITFEMPVATFFLARIGMVTHRSLINFGRYAIVAMFVAAAVLTPPDVVSQVLMAGPLLLLYGVSIGVAWMFGHPATEAPESDESE
jgi:sec-independent protein translocase protein TatC